MSSMIEVQKVENTAVTHNEVPCWVVGNTVQCLVGGGTVSAYLQDSVFILQVNGASHDFLTASILFYQI